ncbi:hypothetical protein IT570_06885 [Candidatus Sumerlaeota bacterium]|nr:hypothetical protein [Candidatus Sumerlaeota bacterium]
MLTHLFSFQTRRLHGLLLLALPVLLLSGCTPVVRSRTLPPSIRNVYVPMIVNRTAMPGLEEELTVALQEEILADGRLNLVKQKDADAVVRVTLIQFVTAPEKLDEDKFGTRQTWTIEADMEVEENIPGRPLIGGIRKVLATHGYNADTRTTTFNGEPFERELLATNFGRVAAMELISGEFDTFKELSAGTRDSGVSTRTLKTRR